MGFYDDRILPWVITKTCGTRSLDGLRTRVCEPLAGRVVEVGFGSGFNIGRYPPAVTGVWGVEPSDRGWELGAQRRERSTVPIRRAGLDGQRLPFGDDEFDAALSTFTLCTIPDLPAALSELRRVVKPGGVFAFLEHGSAPDAGVRRAQRGLEPFQKRLGGGCHLTREIAREVHDAGWELVDVDSFYADIAPKPFTALTLGLARRPLPGVGPTD